MEKAELLEQICEKIQEVDSQNRKDKRLTKTSRELKKTYEFLKKYKTDEHLNEQFQKKFLSDGNASTRFRQEPAMENRENNGKDKKSLGRWLDGCQLCNAGIIVEMKKKIETGLSVNKASKILSEMATKQIGGELYSAAAIRARYLLHTGKRNPHPKIVHREQLKIEKPRKNM